MGRGKAHRGYRVAGALVKTPVVDAMMALVPGLCGQSMVANNHEISAYRI
jgi:hypothetical protein